MMLYSVLPNENRNDDSSTGWRRMRVQAVPLPSDVLSACLHGRTKLKQVFVRMSLDPGWSRHTSRYALMAGYLSSRTSHSNYEWSSSCISQCELSYWSSLGAFASHVISYKRYTKPLLFLINIYFSHLSVVSRATMGSRVIWSPSNYPDITIVLFAKSQ